MNRKDPAGYYSLLGVSETASATDIKAAFRLKAKEFHPDLNPSPNAVRQFQKINKAYEVLSNPETRAQYDTLYIQVPQSESKSHHWDNLEPIACSSCRKVTAQPRYVIFYQVMSFIAFTIRSPVQGIFCPTCAERKALQSTIVTWLVGWWGLPWGVFYSLVAVLTNLFGGSKPNEANARLLTYQAWIFVTQNKYDLACAVAADANDLACAVAADANDLARKVKTAEGARLQHLTGELLCALGTNTPIKRLKNAWSVTNRSFYLQSGVLGAFVALAIAFVSNVPAETTPTASPSQATESLSESSQETKTTSLETSSTPPVPDAQPTEPPSPEPVPDIVSRLPQPLSASTPASNSTNARVVGEPGAKNIRSGAGTSYSVKRTANTGARVQVITKGSDQGGYLWYEVYLPTSQTKGWIAGHLIQLDAGAQIVP